MSEKNKNTTGVQLIYGVDKMKIDFQKILCALGFHNYDKWGEPYTFGYTDFQRRVCNKCGYEITRKIGWSKDRYKIKGNSPPTYSYKIKCSGDCENCNLNEKCEFSKKN